VASESASFAKQRHSREQRGRESEEERRNGMTSFGDSSDILKEIFEVGHSIFYLYGTDEDDTTSWLEQIELIAQLRGLSDSAKIALAVLLCKGKALEKARPLNRSGTSKAFLERLIQELAPESRWRIW
jgi:hypothetical protein